MRQDYASQCAFGLIFLILYGSLRFTVQELQDVKLRSDSVNLTTNINNALTASNNLNLIQAALAVSPNVALNTSPSIVSPVVKENANFLNNQPVNGIIQFPPANQLLRGVPATASTSNQPVTLIPNPVANQEDSIIQLDFSSINDEVLRRRRASFVYFNANFNHCRNCYRFFNIWKELATDIRSWRPVVSLFAINCSDEDNIDVCRKAGATQLPQVKFYWVMSNSLENDGQRIRILGKSVHAMRHVIMDKIFDSYIEHKRLLAQRNQLQQAPPKVPSMGANNLLQAAQTNPLSSLMGPIGQMLASGMAGGSSAGLGSFVSSLMSGKIGATSAGGGGGGSSAGGLMSSLGGVQGLNQIMNFLMGASSMSQRLTAQPLANNWPRLESLEVGDTQQLLNLLPLDETKSSSGALLIMETQEFLHTGLEVMLDLTPYANQTYFVRVRDDRSSLSKNLTRRDDIQAPALIYLTAKREPKLLITAPKYTNDEDLRRAFVRTFERKQIKYPVRRIWSIAPGNNIVQERRESNEEEEELTSKVYMNDLTNTIRASLMEQVFRHPDLSDDQYNALVKYVYVLINYFPFNNDESLKFFKRLHGWLQNQVSPIDIGEYKKQFHDIDDYLQQRDWIGCKSLNSSKSVPGKNRKSNFLFENPGQIGKVVSNLTRLFRAQQQQTSKFKNLFNVFASNMQPLLVNQTNQAQANSPVANNNTGSSTPAPNLRQESSTAEKRSDSPLERIIKSLTSGSLGSDSSILKLISTALTGGSSDSSGATRKSKFAREYPCGAWKLAHVMVVNEYIKDSPRKDVKHIVFHSLYQYMLHFYACPTCGNRISDVSGEFRLNLDDHLQDQPDSVMFLWKIHNRISKRLESETRPSSPAKIQFPPEFLCPKCRSPRAQSELVSTPDWQEKQVLNFLVHFYRPQSLLLKKVKKSSSTQSNSIWSGFSLSSSSPSSSSSAAATTTTVSMITCAVSCFTTIFSTFFSPNLYSSNSIRFFSL